MTKILVTGSNGFIGRQVIKRLNKSEVISYFNLSSDSPILYTNQLQANPILICKNDFTTAFIYEWYKICSENYHLIDDSMTVPQHKEYIENRHDQSVFSLLAKRYNIISTTVARDVIETNRNRSGYSEFEEGSNKYTPYKRIRPVTQSIGFILLRHVNSVAANQYWQYLVAGLFVGLAGGRKDFRTAPDRYG